MYKKCNISREILCFECPRGVRGKSDIFVFKNMPTKLFFLLGELIQLIYSKIPFPTHFMDKKLFLKVRILSKRFYIIVEWKSQLFSPEITQKNIHDQTNRNSNRNGIQVKNSLTMFFIDYRLYTQVFRMHTWRILWIQ